VIRGGELERLRDGGTKGFRDEEGWGEGSPVPDFSLLTLKRPSLN